MSFHARRSLKIAYLPAMAVAFGAGALIAIVEAAATNEGITTFGARILSVKENGILISANVSPYPAVSGMPAIELEGEPQIPGGPVHYPEGTVSFQVHFFSKLMPKLFCTITTSTDQNGNAVAPEDALQALALCCKRKTPVTGELRGFILRCRKKVNVITSTDAGTVGTGSLSQSTSTNEYLKFADGYRLRTRLVDEKDRKVLVYDANVKLCRKDSPFIIYADVKSVGADAERDAAGAGDDVKVGRPKP